jgi:F420H(2)-dependent quinone reductase
MSAAREHRRRLPPRWFVRLAWHAHRGLYRFTGGRAGLWRPKATGWGALHLTTTGRRTGREPSVIVGYYEDGPNLIGMATNGWARRRACLVAQPPSPS